MKVITTGRDYWLVQKAKRKDPEAFSELWRKNRQHLRHFLGRRIACRALREDIEQQTAMQAWRKIHTFRAKSSFHYWLFSVAINEYFMHLRKNKKYEAVANIERIRKEPQEAIDWITHQHREADYYEAVQPSMQHNPDQDGRLDARRQLARIGRRLNRTAAIYRQVYLARQVHGFSNEEAAAMLKITVPAVKSRLHRARAMILKAANG